MTVLVLGSTGSTGRRVTDQLRARDVAVRAVSRSGPDVFDWERPDTWTPALDGVRAVYVMAPDGVPVDPAFLAQAAEAGVQRLVLLSTMHPEEIGDTRLQAAEAAVRASGINWTVVRAHWFNQNFDEGFFLPAIQAGHLALPLADQRQAFVDATDIAAVAVEALLNDHHAQTYEVTGPQALTFAEACEIISTVTHRDITFDGTPEGYLATPGATEDTLNFFLNQLQLGDSVPTTTVEHLTGRPATPFRTYAEQAAPAWT
ncbi:NAD(P)H-binding protein [Kribbella sp. NPDC051770]|uniref:SDR family oxidoreductase n=1 Tax=Kribbella sp. NPDC051770 TaxID=3155413 RepID=UPI00343E7C0B